MRWGTIKHTISLQDLAPAMEDACLYLVGEDSSGGLRWSVSSSWAGQIHSGGEARCRQGWERVLEQDSANLVNVDATRYCTIHVRSVCTVYWLRQGPYASSVGREDHANRD